MATGPSQLCIPDPSTRKRKHGHLKLVRETARKDYVEAGTCQRRRACRCSFWQAEQDGFNLKRQGARNMQWIQWDTDTHINRGRFQSDYLLIGHRRGYGQS